MLAIPDEIRVRSPGEIYKPAKPLSTEHTSGRQGPFRRPRTPKLCTGFIACLFMRHSASMRPLGLQRRCNANLYVFRIRNVPRTGLRPGLGSLVHMSISPPISSRAFLRHPPVKAVANLSFSFAERSSGSNKVRPNAVHVDPCYLEHPIGMV